MPHPESKGSRLAEIDRRFNEAKERLGVRGTIDTSRRFLADVNNVMILLSQVKGVSRKLIEQLVVIRDRLESLGRQKEENNAVISALRLEFAELTLRHREVRIAYSATIDEFLMRIFTRDLRALEDTERCEILSDSQQRKRSRLLLELEQRQRNLRKAYQDLKDNDDIGNGVWPSPRSVGA